uniref:Uncharacterized protein n=1 Tax=Anguilla anguilla TaxID=7936 RepID=A0A0E9VQS8_ANGAN
MSSATDRTTITGAGGSTEIQSCDPRDSHLSSTLLFFIIL